MGGFCSAAETPPPSVKLSFVWSTAVLCLVDEVGNGRPSRVERTDDDRGDYRRDDDHDRRDLGFLARWPAHLRQLADDLVGDATYLLLPIEHDGGADRDHR